MILLDYQYYVMVSNGSLGQSFSTNPVRGPVPVWNQTFSLPVKSYQSEIKFEILKYDQYKINESFGEFRYSLHKLSTDPVSESTITSSTGIDLKIKTEFIPKRSN